MIKEKEFHSDTFESPLLSSQCGFDVTVSFTGSVTVKTFPNRPVGPQSLTLEILAVVFSAGNKTVRFQQVETSITQVKPDEVRSAVRATSTVAGKTVEFTGVQKIDLNTGKTILQSHNVSGAAREAICERLKG
jgi:hypothetical protein